MDPLDFALNEIDNASWRQLPEEVEESINELEIVYSLGGHECDRLQRERAVREREIRERDIQRKKMKWARKMDAKTAVKLIDCVSGKCDICWTEDVADTRVVHHGEEGHETKHDWCKARFCWDCLHNSIKQQTVSYDETMVYPKCPVCNNRICYRVTKGDDMKKFATKLKPFKALTDDEIVRLAWKNNMVRVKKNDNFGGFFYKCMPFDKVNAFKKEKRAHGEKWIGGTKKSVKDCGTIEWYWTGAFGRYQRYCMANTWSDTRDALMRTDVGKKLHEKRVPTFKRRVIKSKPRKNFKVKREHL